MSKCIKDLIFLHKNTCFKPIKGRYEIWLLDTLKCSVQCIGQIIGGDFAKFCGLLRIYEL